MTIHLPGGTYSVAEFADAYYPDQAHMPGTLQRTEPDSMENHDYGVIVCPHLIDQVRIRLLDMRKDAGDNIVCEIASKKNQVAVMTSLLLALAPDPEEFCRDLADRHGLDDNGRITLDETR